MKRTSFFGMAAALLVLSATSAFAQVPVPDVAHFRFDSVGATTPNDVAGGGDATWFGDSGANTLALGIINGGSQTNDENGGNGQEHYRVDLPLMDGADGLTISLWFNQNVANNDNSTYNGLFMVRDLVSSFGGGGENWGVALENNSSPRHIDWRIDGGPGPEDDLIMGNVQDRWDHVVFTWDGTDQGDGMGERALFLNGTELQREDAPLGTITDSGTWRIGDDACCGGREFTGTLDDLAVWSQALTAAEAMELHSNGLAGIDAAGVLPDKKGDVDLDTDTDLVDLQTIRENLFRDFGGATVTRADGDLNGDGAVTFVDYREWKTEYDSENLPGSSNVPEPASAVLLLLSTIGLGAARRRS